MYGASLGLKSMGRVQLGGERFVTYDTMAYVTLGRRSERIHLHGIDDATVSFFASVYATSTSSTPNPNDIRSRRIIKSVDRLVKDLKSTGLWDLCSIIYPFASYYQIGTNIFADGFNIKSPGTTPSDFFLTYTSSQTHNQYGVALDQGLATVNTQFNAGTSLGTNDWHLCVYVQSQEGSMGASQNYLSSANATGAILLLINPGASIRLDGNGRAITASVGARKGCIIGTRTSSSLMSLYRGGELVGTNSSAVVNSLPSAQQRLMYNQATGTLQCICPFSFCSMGSSLTDDQAFRMAQIVQDYQTRMGRGC